MNRNRNSRWRAFSHSADFTTALRILSTTVLAAIGGSTHAVPVTLQFEAIVGPPRIAFDGPLPPAWSIPLQPGEIISGTFTFEPFDAPSNTSITRVTQPFDFTFHIKTQDLTTSQYGIEVYNNSNAFDDEGINPSDDIYVGCSHTPSCIPTILTTPDLLHWSFQMILGGYPVVLDGADVPASPDTWQQLTVEGSLNVTFIDSNAHKSYGFRATPQHFRAVPEPSCATLLAILGAGIVFVRSRQLCLSKRCANGGQLCYLLVARSQLLSVTVNVSARAMSN